VPRAAFSHSSPVGSRTVRPDSLPIVDALTATRRDDLQHGITPAYVRGCVCSECREYQRIRMAKTADSLELGFSAHVLAYAHRSMSISPSGLDTAVRLGGSQMRGRAILLAYLVVAASILTTVQANAAGTVYIYKVYFDSPGKDTGSNSSLNAEYVVIKNGDDVSHSVSGWTVKDKAGHRYTFPDGFRLDAGNQAIIHTGDGTSHATSASTHLCWGREWYV
jgi:hypothetical protein